PRALVGAVRGGAAPALGVSARLSRARRPALALDRAGRLHQAVRVRRGRALPGGLPQLPTRRRASRGVRGARRALALHVLLLVVSAQGRGSGLWARLLRVGISRAQALRPGGARARSHLPGSPPPPAPPPARPPRPRPSPP